MGFVGLWKNPRGPSVLMILGGGHGVRIKTEQALLHPLCVSSECVGGTCESDAWPKDIR